MALGGFLAQNGYEVVLLLSALAPFAAGLLVIGFIREPARSHAGMEGALASVVGGLVSVPLIAVPTSAGYGASFNGLAALLAMLNSCASGVTVVNIDNGFGAAFAACQILKLEVGSRQY